MIGIFSCPLSVSPLAPDISLTVVAPAIKDIQKKVDGYSRPISSTYLIFPEWYIVYSSREYADFIKSHPPSGFPYFASIEQYWCAYHAVYVLTKNDPFNVNDHIMLTVIGTSLSAEYVIKGLYENSVGRFTEWLSSGEPVEEDRYAQKVAQEYVEFIPLRPWFEFDFKNSLKGLWQDTSWTGPHMIRKWERKIILSLEYSVKAVYGWIIGLGSHATLGAASDNIYTTIKLPSVNVMNNSSMEVIMPIENDIYIISIPHEQPFTENVKKLSISNAEFIDISANHTILISLITPKGWQYHLPAGKALFTMNILTDASKQRIAVQMPVKELLPTVRDLERRGLTLEHVYDF